MGITYIEKNEGRIKMDNVQEKNRQKLVIVVVMFVLIILPLLIAIIANIISINSIIPEKVVVQSNVSDDIVQFVANELDMGGSRYVVHEIARDGDYIALRVSIMDADGYGDSMLMVVYKTSEGYEASYTGTDYDKESLLELGISRRIVNNVIGEDSTMDKYAEAIDRASVNPVTKYPLIDNLPYKTDDLLIDYYFEEGLTDDDSVSIPIIEIRGTDAAERKRALNVIREFGYDPGDYRIVFTNFNNHFTEEMGEGETMDENIDDGEGP